MSVTLTLDQLTAKSLACSSSFILVEIIHLPRSVLLFLELNFEWVGARYTGNFFAYSLDHQLLPGISFSLKWVLAFVFFPLKFKVFFNVASPHKWDFCRFNRSPVATVFILSKSKVSAEFLFLFFHTLFLVEIYMASMCSWHFILAYHRFTYAISSQPYHTVRTQGN